MEDYVVRFEFELSPIDAENFAHLFTEERCRILQKILDEMADQEKPDVLREARIKWYRDHIAYMDEMQEKVIGSSKAVPLEKTCTE